jgi:hypothetical protein
MSKRACSVGRAMPLAMLLAIGGTGTAGAENCLTSPDRKAEPGTRWYYQTDAVTQQRCFYLRKDATPKRGPAEQAASPNDDSIMSWLSQRFSPSTGAEQAGPGAGPGQAAPAAATKSKPPRPAAKPAPTTLSQQSAQQPPAGSGGTGATPFDTNTREALFKEYVEWRKRKGLPAE